MASFQRLRALFCLTVVWLCAWAITPALAQTPSTPTLTQVFDNVLPITGAIANGGVTNDHRPTFAGHVNSSDATAVTIYDNGVVIGFATFDPSGGWIFTPVLPLLDGPHSFTFTVTANNSTSLPTAPYTVVIDTISPGTPTVSNGVSGSGMNSMLWTFTGTAESNSTITLYDNGVLLAGAIPADGAGNWAYTTTAPLSAGTNALSVTATDAAGNVSLPSSSYSVNGPLSNSLLALPGGGGQAQVAIDSDTTGCTVNTPPAFVQANLSGAPANATAPLGALTFDVTGCPGATLTVRITYPSGRLATLTPYKFGPASAGAASTWFAHGNVVGDSVIYTVTDNGVGDSNPAPGVIADPFAPMLLAAPGPATVQHVPTLSQWALMLLTVLLAGLGLHAQRRKALV